MPQRLIVPIKSITTMVGIVVGLFGAYQSYAILPYKVEENRKRLEIMETKAAMDHEMLVKMSMDIQYIKENIAKR
jgi:hypothetical protein